MTDATVAAIDIGTNTVRMLVAGPGGEERLSRVCGLGRGLAESGRLNQQGVEAALAVLAGYRTQMEAAGVVAARAVATAAARDASDTRHFLDRAAGVLGFRPEVITGTEEAALSYAGATVALGGEAWTVVDIGGGSTELIDRLGAVSLPLGSVRITDRHFLTLPAGQEAVEAALGDCTAVLGARPDGPGDRHHPSSPPRLAGVAGTWTSLRDITRAGAASGTGPDFLLTLPEVSTWVDRLASMSVDSIAAVPGLDPARAPVILGGAVVALSVLHWWGGGEEITITEHDLLDAIVARLRQS